MILKRRALLGLGPDDDKRISALSRLHYLNDIGGEWCLTHEPYPKHTEILMEQLHPKVLKGWYKPVTTPGEKKDNEYANPRKLNSLFAKQYGSAIMRFSYLVNDLPHLQYGAHKVAKHMAKLIRGGRRRVKRASRFLAGSPRWAHKFVARELVTA